MNSHLKKILTVCLTILLMQTFAVSLFSQVTESGGNKNQPVNWQMLTGKNNEFFFVMPEGSSIYTDQDYYLDTEYTTEIESEKTLVRAVNNTVLLISLFEGNGKAIHNELLARFRKIKSDSDKPFEILTFSLNAENQKSLKIKESEVNGFGLADISADVKGYSAKVQIFWNKNHVYYLEALSHKPNDPITKNYFEGIKLVNKDKVASPNLNDKVEDFASAKIVLPAPISENAKPSKEVVDEGKVEKKPVLIYLPSLPPLSVLDRKLDRAYTPIDLKVLFSADGTVSDVEFITILSSAFEKEVLKAVKEIKFLPAETQGNPVSVYGTMRYSYYYRRG